MKFTSLTVGLALTLQAVEADRCTIQQNIDRHGYDYAQKYTGTLDKCAEACAKDDDCITAQFHRDNGYCYFKDTANDAVYSDTTDTVDCRVPRGQPSTRGRGGGVGTTTRGRGGYTPTTMRTTTTTTDRGRGGGMTTTTTRRGEGGDRGGGRGGASTTTRSRTTRTRSPARTTTTMCTTIVGGRGGCLSV